MEKDVGTLSIFLPLSFFLSLFFFSRVEKADKGDNAVGRSLRAKMSSETGKGDEDKKLERQRYVAYLKVGTVKLCFRRFYRAARRS